MAADATNLIWGPLANLRALIAASESFQSLVGVAAADLGTDAAATTAAARVFCPAQPNSAAEPVTAARPFAVIDHGDDRQIVRAGSGCFASTGSLLWMLEANVPAAHAGATAAQLEAAHTWFTALLGDILDEMLALADSGGYLAVRSVTVIAAPQRADGETAAGEGDFYQATLSIDWEGGA